MKKGICVGGPYAGEEKTALYGNVMEVLPPLVTGPPRSRISRSEAQTIALFRYKYLGFHTEDGAERGFWVPMDRDANWLMDVLSAAYRAAER